MAQRQSDHVHGDRDRGEGPGVVGREPVLFGLVDLPRLVLRGHRALHSSCSHFEFFSD
jgi:hypothetical protein